MSMPRGGSSSKLSDSAIVIFDTLARWCMWLGAGALVVGIGMLIFTGIAAPGGTPGAAEQAKANIELFSDVAFVGAIVGSLATAWILWGEETLGPLLIIVGSLLYFFPAYAGGLGVSTRDFGVEAMSSVSVAGIPVAAIGLMAIMLDIAQRMRIRSSVGTRAEHLKFGQGVKVQEERDIRNVFLGKCWQLPFCRKFIRERCPIYHSKRTCWKERVGCMCEESVIQNAMAGKVIPKNIVAASKMIPYNRILTPNQKRERCNVCVIYNEHLKHKYKLALPVTILSLALIYVAFRTSLVASVESMLISADEVFGRMMFSRGNEMSEAAKTTSLTEGVIPYGEIVLIAGLLIVLAYIVRFLEYLFFTLKV